MNKSKIYTFFSGIIIGLGVVLPGVSGSVLAIILGIYNDVIYLLNDSTKTLFYKIKKLIPISLGLLFGIILFGNILIFLISSYEIQIKYLFIGLILGSIPILNKQSKVSENFDSNIKYIVITFLISLSLFMLSDFDLIKYKGISTSFLTMLLAGFLYISGKIIPGISSSFFLMILGMYDYILNIISNPFSISIYEFVKLIPFFIGIIIGLITLIKVINYFLINYKSRTYSIIIGFVLGSIIAIYPGFRFEMPYIISIFIMCISFYFTYKLGVKK